MTRFTTLANNARHNLHLRLGLGLDVEYDRLPPSLIASFANGDGHPMNYPAGRSAVISEFMVGAATSAGRFAAALKPNLAFAEGERYGQGEATLRRALRRIRNAYNYTPVVVDGKRGDIGNSAKGYARRLFNPIWDSGGFNADAVTISPYLGDEDAMDVFFDEKDRTSFVLCRTSNKGAAAIQDELMLLDDELTDHMLTDGLMDLATPAVIGKSIAERSLVPQYLRMALLARYRWNRHGNVGLVVGATAPEQLRNVCQVVKGTGIELLIPGSKTQGGKLEEVIPILQSKGCYDQATIFISRAALYPEEGKDDEHWVEAIEARFRALHEEARRIAA